MFNQENHEVAAAQRVMLDILCEIHKICVKNDIQYWLTEGTLLGAVRHKGFIPWDDDCDVGMMREEYERFLKVAPKFLPPDMHLQTRDMEPCYHLPFAKIRKDDTLLIETGETGEEKYHHGIFVDIFPYDRYSSKWFVKWMNWCVQFRNIRKKYRKGSLKRFLVTVYANILMLIPVEISKQVYKYAVRHPEKWGDEKSPYIACGLDCGDSYPILEKFYFPLKLKENCFEGKSFYVPSSEKEVLENRYGSTYNELPPEIERKTHAKLIKIN